MQTNDRRILIAYFSRKGMNFARGQIVELAKGNTQIAAELIAEQTGGELFQIVPKEDYPFEYRPCVDRAMAEWRSDARPELAGQIDISGYDTIFVCYPNWCGTMPMCVWTFLEGHDFSGKLLLPLCTNEGSGMGSSQADLARLTPGAAVKPGLSIRGCAAADSGNAIAQWIQNL